MTLVTVNHVSLRHCRLSHPIPRSQGPRAKAGRVHGILHTRSGATVDELMGSTWANNIMAASTPDFSGLTLGSQPINSLVNYTRELLCIFEVTSFNTKYECPNWTVKWP